jgi:hypothetical protein
MTLRGILLHKGPVAVSQYGRCCRLGHESVFKLPLLALTLCLVACGNEQPLPAYAAGTDVTAATDEQPSRPSLACTSDAECPSAERCGFQGKSSSRCIVDNHTPSCIPAGGSCGCDGQPVERICDAKTGLLFTSRPACFLGPCPKPCSDSSQCPSSLTCRNGMCGNPLRAGTP